MAVVGYPPRSRLENVAKSNDYDIQRYAIINLFREILWQKDGEAYKKLIQNADAKTILNMLYEFHYLSLPTPEEIAEADEKYAQIPRQLKALAYLCLKQQDWEGLLEALEEMLDYCD